MARKARRRMKGEREPLPVEPSSPLEQAVIPTPEAKLLELQGKAGNRAVARMLSSGEGPVLARVPAKTQADPKKPVSKPKAKADPALAAERERRFFIDRTIPALAYVVEQYAALRAKAERLAAAYEKAWTAHTKALDDAKASERLLGDIMVDAALAFIPGGIGGMTGEFFKNAKSSPFVVDGMSAPREDHHPPAGEPWDDGGGGLLAGAR